MHYFLSFLFFQIQRSWTLPKKNQSLVAEKRSMTWCFKGKKIKLTNYSRGEQLLFSFYLKIPNSSKGGNTPPPHLKYRNSKRFFFSILNSLSNWFRTDLECLLSILGYIIKRGSCLYINLTAWRSAEVIKRATFIWTHRLHSLLFLSFRFSLSLSPLFLPLASFSPSLFLCSSLDHPKWLRFSNVAEILEMSEALLLIVVVKVAETQQ